MIQTIPLWKVRLSLFAARSCGFIDHQYRYRAVSHISFIDGQPALAAVVFQ